jgi:hypothetical protein
MATPNYALPPNFADVYFQYENGDEFNGEMQVHAVRDSDGHSYPVYFYNIANGSIEAGAANTLINSFGAIGCTYHFKFLDANGAEANTTVAASLLSGVYAPDLGTVYQLPLMYYPVDLTANITPQSPHNISLQVDGVEAGTGHEQLVYSGNARVIELWMHGVEIFQKAILAPGALVVNLELSSTERQLNTSDFELEGSTLKNNSGRPLPEVVLYSV